MRTSCRPPLVSVHAAMLQTGNRAATRAAPCCRFVWLAGLRCTGVTHHLSISLPAHTRAVPEMQRSDLAGTVLQLKSLGIDNIMSFEWLAPPPAEVSAATTWNSATRYTAAMKEGLSWGWVQRRACNCSTLCFTCHAHLCPPLAPQTMVRALETLHALGALDGDARLARPYGTQVHSQAVFGNELWLPGVEAAWCRHSA